MNGVKFFSFPKPVVVDSAHALTVKCREWIKACGRPVNQLNIEKIDEDFRKKKYYYKVCSKVGFYTLFCIHLYMYLSFSNII